MARNHSRSGRCVEAKIVPAIGEVWRRQLLHWNSPRLITSQEVRPPQTGHSHTYISNRVPFIFFFFHFLKKERLGEERKKKKKTRKRPQGGGRYRRSGA